MRQLVTFREFDCKKTSSSSGSEFFVYAPFRVIVSYPDSFEMPAQRAIPLLDCACQERHTLVDKEEKVLKSAGCWTTMSEQRLSLNGNVTASAQVHAFVEVDRHNRNNWSGIPKKRRR